MPQKARRAWTFRLESDYCRIEMTFREARREDLLTLESDYCRIEILQQTRSILGFC